MMHTLVITSSPLRGEEAERSEAGGGVKPFTKETRQKAKVLRRRPTEAEKKLWYFLRNKQMGIKFRRQQTIGPYIVDFISFDAKLIIEVDGGQHAIRQTYDTARDAFLRQEGYNVLRFWNNEILENINDVVQNIMASHPLLTSPLQGEERIRGDA